MSRIKTTGKRSNPPSKQPEAIALSLQNVVFDEISSSIQNDSEGLPIKGISQRTFLKITTSISGTLSQNEDESEPFVALNVQVKIEAKSKDNEVEGNLFASQVSAVGFYSIGKGVNKKALTQALEEKSDALIPYFNMTHALVTQELIRSIHLMGLPPPPLSFSLDKDDLRK